MKPPYNNSSTVDNFKHSGILIAAKERKPIKITLPDGKVLEGKSWETTPYSIACSIRYNV